MSILGFPAITITDDVQVLVQQLVIQTEVLKRLPIPPHQEQHIFHEQVLKSSLFSAKIEGIHLSPSTHQAKQEISNVLSGFRCISTLPETLKIKHWQMLHQIVMNKISSQAGHLRQEPSAIYDQFGSIVYVTPNPEQMHQMIDVWFEQASLIPNQQLSLAEKLVRIFACHYYFEKIHPFIDGNGRTGRLLLHYQLQQLGIFSQFTIPIDHYCEQNKTSYYAFLELNTRQLTHFYIFMLKGLLAESEQLLKTVANSDRVEPAQLLPRRQEIFNIINDHPLCSLDMIYRRFPSVPKRTLAYDLHQLVKKKLVTQHGVTRGVRYSVSDSTIPRTLT